MQMNPYNDYIVFLDLEMTGTDVNKDRIVEIGVLVTDWELDFVGEFTSTIFTYKENMQRSDEVVWDMHNSSGLYQEVPFSSTLSEVENDVIEFLHRLNMEPGKVVIAGYSVQFDKMFLDRWMPDLAKMLHWRILDISTIRSMNNHWSPNIYSQFSTHRALADCYEAREELRFYRENLFKQK